MTTKTRLTAADVMQRRVETVRPNLLVGELAHLLDEKRIGGVAVVDADARLVGVVSMSDLVHHETEGGVYEPEGRRLPAGFHIETPDRTTVADIMTPAVVEAPPQTPVARLARLMRRRRIHRVFITKGQTLLGIVTTLDLLKLLEEGR